MYSLPLADSNGWAPAIPTDGDGVGNADADDDRGDDTNGGDDFGCYDAGDVKDITMPRLAYPWWWMTHKRHAIRANTNTTKSLAFVLRCLR